MHALILRRSPRNFTSGFSLVELAISLLIIGLILGGILKGQELIVQARLQKTLSQIISYQMAYLTFKEKYQALPGDFAGASYYWGETARDGNQNGRIEGKGRELHTEATAFWHHLTLAHLISVSRPLSISSSHVMQYGQGLPASPLGGGFTVEESPDSLNGLWLILGSEAGLRGTGALLTPEQAAFLNRKLDDGYPLSGHVQSREGEGVPLGQCIEGGAYNLRVKDKTCVLYVCLE